MNRKGLNNSSVVTVLVMALGLAFIITGIWRHEFTIVLEKAINICLECVGIG